MPVLPLCLALAALPEPQAPAPIAAEIREVTVYGSTALVHRVAQAPGTGTWVVRGLPRAVEPDSVRVRARGGDVASVEVRERMQEAVPSDRVQALRDRLEELRRELQGLEDQRKIGVEVDKHLSKVLDVEAQAHKDDVQSNRPQPEAWAASLAFVTGRMEENRRGLRELGWRIDEVQRRIQEVETELGRLQGEGPVPVLDVLVEVVAAGAGKVDLDVDTFVNGTGWRPLYDLRTASDLSKVELVYRAQVWQQTGEDWNDVDLLLSTAQPQLGAQGPEPLLPWLNLVDPKAPTPKGRRGRAMDGLGYSEEAASADMKAVAGEAVLGRPAAPFASVQQEGLSVRFRLPQKETIESRDQPTSVLVGRKDLAIAPERYCVPALDTTVWLRAKAENTSEWTLLPGQAAVFFGNDFLGHAFLETIQPGQEITLHLGADTAVTVERTLTDDQKKEPSFLSSRVSHVERWRIHFENHGTVSRSPDGGVEVILQEALPRAQDDRISVELTEAKPKPSDDVRWKQDKDEKSLYTWIVKIPRGGETDVVIETTIQYPKGLEVVRHY